MYKQILFIFSFFYLFSFIYSQSTPQDQCTPIIDNYLKANEHCSGPDVKRGFICPPNYFCNLTTTFCGPETKKGQPCSTPTECGDLFCFDKVCTPVNFSPYAGTCIDYNSCVPGLNCENSTCVLDYSMTGTQCKSNSDCPNQRICKGGFCWKKTCYDDLNCPLGEYCSETNICAPKLVDGSTCLEYTNCKYTKTCTYNKKSTKTCMPAFSVKEGGKCDPALFDPTDSKTLLSYDCDIGKGLFCDKDGICKKYKQKNTNCTEDSSICNPIEQCGCASNGQDSVCIPSIHLNQVCKERLNDLWTCVVKNDHLLFPESIYSPMYDSCGSQVCKVVEKCFIDLPSNSLLQYCNIDPTLVREPYSSSSSLIQSEEEQNHSKSTTSAPLQHSESHNLSSDNPSPVESSTNTNNTTTQKPIKDVQNNSSMKISLNYYFLLSLLMIVITII